VVVQDDSTEIFLELALVSLVGLLAVELVVLTQQQEVLLKHLLFLAVEVTVAQKSLETLAEELV
jgi:hypothetical protein